MHVLRKGTFSWFHYLILQRLLGVIAMNPFLNWAPSGFRGVKTPCCVFNGDFIALACRFGLLQGLGRGSVRFKQL